MIVVSGSIELDAAHEDEFLVAVEALVEATVAEPGCRAYSFWRDLRRPGLFHVFEEWEDDESLITHTAADHYRAFAAAMGGFGVTAVSVDRYDVAAKAALR